MYLDALSAAWHTAGLTQAPASTLTHSHPRLPDLGTRGPALPLPQQELAKAVVNWLTGELFGRLHQDGASVSGSAISGERLGELVALVHTGEISGKIGKDMLELMYAGDARRPGEIVAAHGWAQLNDPVKIRELCVGVVSDPALASTIARYK